MKQTKSTIGYKLGKTWCLNRTWISFENLKYRSTYKFTYWCHLTNGENSNKFSTNLHFDTHICFWRNNRTANVHCSSRLSWGSSPCRSHCGYIDITYLAKFLKDTAPYNLPSEFPLSLNINVYWQFWPKISSTIFPSITFPPIDICHFHVDT